MKPIFAKICVHLLVGLIVCPGLAGQEQLPAPAPYEMAAGAQIIQNGLDVRIKDIAQFEGQRKNVITGMGLVTGLNGTGGKSPITRQFALSMVERFGQRADTEQRARLRTEALDKTASLSVVTITANIDENYHKKGKPIDVIVSTFDDATSLQGGVLMPTPLYAVDGEVYALASGLVSIGGFSFSGDAASVQKNHPTTGRIFNGAMIEKDICKTPLGVDGTLTLHLTNPDFETSSRIATSINQFYPDHARILGPGSILIKVPDALYDRPNDFAVLVESIRITPDVEARVIINERTGTVVVGENVRLSRVAITHANLSVLTGESPLVSQPSPFSDGETTVVPRTEIDVIEERSSVNVIEQSVTVGELARALNSLGVTPRDLSSIFQMLKASGSLHAKLEFR